MATTTNIEERATQPMEARGCVSQFEATNEKGLSGCHKTIIAMHDTNLHSALNLCALLYIVQIKLTFSEK